MSTIPTPPPSVPGASESATGGNAESNVKFVSAEDFDGHKKFLNKEFLGQRKELEGLGAKLSEITEALATLKPAAATGNDKSKDLPTAEIERKVKSLEDQLQKAEREKSNALISKAIADSISGTTKEAQAVLALALKAQTKVETVNGESIVVVEGEDGPQRLTAEWVRKSLGDYWFPASGKAGSGLNEAGGAGNSGVDVERGMREQEYFEKNKDAILAEMARRRNASA